MLEGVDGLVDALPAEVEGGVEGSAFLVDVVVDALEPVARLARFVDGEGVFLSGREPVEGDGHADAVAFDDGFAAFDFDYLGVGLLAVDGDDGADGEGGGANRADRAGGGQAGRLRTDGGGMRVVEFLFLLLEVLAGAEGGFALGLGGTDVADGLLDGAVGVGKDLSGLVAGGRDDVVAPRFEVGGEALVFGCDFGEEVVGNFQLGALARYLLLVEFYLLELVLEVELGVADFVGGVFEHFGREAYVLCYLEGEGTARVPDGEAVEWAHAFCVEEHGAVEDARMGVGHEFEVGEVGSNNAESAAAVEFFEDGLGYGATGAGFGAAAEFVEEEECPLPCTLQHLLHVLQVGGVGAEVVVDGLLVADVDEEVVEDAEFGGFAAGDEEAALEHILDESDGLEADGFAACVGAGDDEDAVGVVEVEAEGDNLLPLAGEEKERVAGIEKADFGDGVDDGPDGVEGDGEARFGTDEVEAREDPIGIEEGVDGRSQGFGETGKDALYLMVFGELEFAEVVAEFDDLGGLEVGGLSGGGFVVDEAFDFAAVGVEHGDDGATVADGGLGVLRGPAFLFGSGKLTGDLSVDFAAFAEDLATDVEEGVGGVVEDFAFVVDDFSGGFEDGGVEVDTRSQLAEAGIF